MVLCSYPHLIYVNELKETVYEKPNKYKKYVDAHKEIVFSLTETDDHSFLPFYGTYSKNITPAILAMILCESILNS